jgi:hypothetical protein
MGWMGWEAEVLNSAVDCTRNSIPTLHTSNESTVSSIALLHHHHCYWHAV